MREIKFRVWDESSKTMKHKISPFGAEASDDLNDFFEESSYHDNIYLQYTGIKDKNGKEIWEGDMVEFCFNDYTRRKPRLNIKGKGKIIFDEETARFVVAPIEITDQQYNLYMSINPNQVSIIGNIYENPELLRR